MTIGLLPIAFSAPSYLAEQNAEGLEKIGLSADELAAIPARQRDAAHSAAESLKIAPARCAHGGGPARFRP